MMSKALVQFSVLVIIFFGAWFLLARFDFMKLFNVEHVTKENEHKIGKLILETIEKEHPELESDTVQAFADKMKHRLCKANDIEDSSITIHVLESGDVNAFALPDRHLVVYTGLIEYCDSAEELCGVMAHEIAHIEHKHVMKKLVKEVGLAMIATIAGGESGGEIARQTAKVLSSTAFDRDQESDADRTAVHYMARANIDPEHFANFMFRVSQEKYNIPKDFTWLSTHPYGQDRAAEILKLRKTEEFHSVPVTDSTTWAGVRRLAKEW